MNIRAIRRLKQIDGMHTSVNKIGFERACVDELN